MSQLVSITITNRGELLPALKTPTVFGFDVEDIVSPIIFNSTTSKSLFTARTNKGGINDDRNGSKINYASSESLSAIAAKSSMLLLLNVVSRRGVAKNSQAYVFVSSKIMESLTAVSGVGTRFYYVEDGDNLPVEYIVSQTIAQIVAQSSSSSFIIQDDGVDMPQESKLNFVGYTVEDNPGNGSTDVIAVKPIEYADLETLRNGSGLPLGAKYLITDRGDAGIIVDVSAPNIISLRAKGLYLVPDFQNVGDYSGLTNPKGANQGVWILTNQATYANGDIVFWSGIMYQVIDDTQFGSNDPESNPNAYEALVKNVTNGYILESHSLSYDFVEDTIFERKDKRGNFVHGPGNFFQWGNDDVYRNFDTGGVFDCINQRGIVAFNVSNSTRAVYISNLSISTVRKNYFGANANVVINECGLTGCVIDSKNVLFEISDGVVFVEKTIDDSRSTFNANLDMSDAAIFSAGDLTIPTELNYIGEFTLINNTGQTINKIINLPDTHKTTRFYSESGNTQSFNHVAVAGAVADTLNADAVVSNAIIGRSSSSDFIEYEKSGIKNIRTNIVKLA